MIVATLQPMTARAEDRATQRCDPSAVPGARTGVGTAPSRAVPLPSLLRLRSVSGGVRGRGQRAACVRRETSASRRRPAGFILNKLPVLARTAGNQLGDSCTKHPTHPLRDWHQSDKPSRQDAATRVAGCPSLFANTSQLKFQFPLKQDKPSPVQESHRGRS